MKLYVQTDGGCKNVEPLEPMRIGVLFPDIDRSFALKIGPGTSNQAEYQAMICAIRAALFWGFDDLEIQSDSQLVVRQIHFRVFDDKISGYDCYHPKIVPLLDQLEKLAGGFKKFQVCWVPRHLNTEADKLANLARDLSPVANPSDWTDDELAQFSGIINITKEVTL